MLSSIPMKISPTLILCILVFGVLANGRSADFPFTSAQPDEVQSPARESSYHPPVGTTVSVQLRRDALGAAGSPISSTVEMYGNTRLNLKGVLASVNDDWVVLRLSEKEQWIARDNILLIETR
jgi:hypothetical protein